MLSLETISSQVSLAPHHFPSPFQTKAKNNCLKNLNEFLCTEVFYPELGLEKMGFFSSLFQSSERGGRDDPGPTGAPQDLKRLKPERLQRRETEARQRTEGLSTCPLQRGPHSHPNVGAHPKHSYTPRTLLP